MPYITDLKPSCSVPVAPEMNAGEVAEPSVPRVPAGEENLADIQPAQENVAPGEQADEMTKRLDEILSRMAEKNCRSLSENELENGLSRVRRDIEVALKDLDGQANPDVRLMNVLGASKGQIEYLAHQREAAEAALREFGTLTGADISQAMALRAAGREGEASAAEKRTLAVIDHAIGTQQAMANAFEDLYRACEGRYAELYDCATRCTARATEIFALSGQLALLAQPEGADAPDRARLLAATARKLLPEYGLKMHGTDTAIEMLRRELKPIADAYAKLNARQGDGAPRPTDLAELALLKARLDTARQALQLVAEEGIVYAEGEDAFRPEPSLLLTLGGQLEQVAIQIDTVLNRSSEALAKGFAREVFVDPLETGFLGENLADILNATGLGTGEEVVSNAREKLAYLSKMSRDYSRALTELAVTGNDASLRQVRAELNSSKGQAACQFVRGLGMRLIVLKCHVERKNPPEVFKRVRVNVAGFRRAFGTSERQRKLIDGLKAMSSVGLLSGCFNLGRSVRLDGAEKQIRALRNRMASFDIGETLNDKLLVSVLKGETTVSSVLAARAW